MLFVPICGYCEDLKDETTINAELFNSLLDEKNHINFKEIEKNAGQVNSAVITLEGYAAQIVWVLYGSMHYVAISSDPEGENIIGFVVFPLDLSNAEPESLNHYRILHTAMANNQRVRVWGSTAWYNDIVIEDVWSIETYASY